MKRLLAALVGGFAAAALTTLLLHMAVQPLAVQRRAVQPRGASARRAKDASPIDDISERDAEALLRELDSLS